MLPFLPSQVIAMQPAQIMPGQAAHPEEERQLRLGQVVGQAGYHVQVGILEYVGGVEPALETRVEPHTDHAPKALVISAQELTAAADVACGSPLEQTARRFRIRPEAGRHNGTND
jgi:hypothetical protein